LLAVVVVIVEQGFLINNFAYITSNLNEIILDKKASDYSFGLIIKDALLEPADI
jgi:hypothetical protein